MKNLKKLLFTALLLLCCVGTSKAEEVTIDGIKYDVVTKGKIATVISGGNYSGDIVIPEAIEHNGVTCSVTTIENYAFGHNCGLTSIVIPNSVTSIEYAFAGCTSLRSVVIGNSVTSIEGAFYYCSGLTSVVIPNSVTSIGERAFDNCSGLTSVVIPNSVTSIGEFAFSSCSGLTSIEIPNSVTSIEYAAFSECTGLTSIEIPNSVTSIGENAFARCTGLTSITIPNSVTSIGEDAFIGCSGLTSVVIPNSVTSIGNFAFNSCSGLTSIVVDGNNTKYDSRENCNAIVETETNTLIQGCKNTVIPNSVTSIGWWAFTSCSDLTSVVIPNSVTSIGNYAFASCSGLTSIEIPNSVTSIGDNAFDNCSGLTSVVIGNSVTTIGERAFLDCTGLTSVVIPNSVTSIGVYAFFNCSGLTSVVIPNSVTSIGERVFANCSGLLNVYCLAKNAPSLDVTAFEGSYPEYMNLYVYPEALSKYQSTEPWSTFGNIIPFAFNLTVSAAGYATLYLDYAVEIPAGVEVYIAKAVEGEYLKMQLVDGVIPANTGVIVKADAGTYTFNGAVNTVPAIEDNLFKGSVEDKMVKVASDEAAYVLSMVDGEVGMYRAELTDGAFLNNANKAYLLLASNRLGIYDEEIDTSTGGQLSNGYRFDFSGITGISEVSDEVKGENGEVKTVYDLQGRKVENPTNGIYIINGKKVLVK